MKGRNRSRNSSLGGEWPPWQPHVALRQALSHPATSPWARVAALAAEQHGTVALWQLRALGFRPRSVRSRCAVGHLYRLYRGVYAVGHPAAPREGRWYAAVLACGPKSYLSNESAIELHRLGWSQGRSIHVSVPRISLLDHQGIRLHRVGSLTPADVASVDGIPVVSVARALLDLAGAGRGKELGEVIGRAQRRRLDVAPIQELIERSRGHRGVAVLRREADGLLPHGGVPTSQFERRFLRLIRTQGFPEPRVNGLIQLEYDTLQVDFHWPELRLVVEADGYASHSDRTAHEEDRRRDQELKRAGWEVVRFTWRQLTREPARTASVIADLIAARTSR